MRERDDIEKLRAIRGRKDLGPRLVVENHREPHGMAEYSMVR